MHRLLEVDFEVMLHRLAVALLIRAAAMTGRVIVLIAPPSVIVDPPAPSPGSYFVWTPGYYRWDGVAYA